MPKDPRIEPRLRVMSNQNLRAALYFGIKNISYL
jgi:hypothetical protein